MPASCRLSSSKSFPSTLASLIFIFLSCFLISVIALEETTKFIYDGWNLVLELTTDDTATLTSNKTYTWGMDISGSMQGAGGVGGDGGGKGFGN